MAEGFYCYSLWSLTTLMYIKVNFSSFRKQTQGRFRDGINNFSTFLMAKFFFWPITLDIFIPEMLLAVSQIESIVNNKKVLLSSTVMKILSFYECFL